MKARTNDPFIYFFVEPNIVFVYKIESENYVTVTELAESGEWQTFELNSGEEFEYFHHEKNEQLIGRGYCLPMDAHKLMAEQINQMIHEQRKSQYQEAVPVHIASSESIAGALRFGIKRPKMVIGFHGFFSIGPIWQLDTEEGRAFRGEWLYDNINLYMESYEYESQFSNTLLEIEDIPEKSPIYIWTANNGNEQTGLLFILQLLKERPNQVFLINTTELYEKWLNSGVDKQIIYHSGEVHPDHLRLLFEKSKSSLPLKSEERDKFQKVWDTLLKSKEVLRLSKNGKIEEAPVDYYDPLILNTIENIHSKHGDKDFIRTAMVIGRVMAEVDEPVNDAFLEYRIRHLVYSGVLEMKGIPKSMGHYRVKLR